MNKSRVTIIICAIMAIIFLWFTWLYEGFRYSYTEEEALVYDGWEADEMTADFEAHQTFVAKERYLKGAAFFLINLPDDRTGSFDVELHEKNGETLAASSYDISKWEVDTWEWLDFDERVTPGKEYEFVITLTDYSGKVIPRLLRVENTDSDNYTWYQNNEYEGNDQCAAMRFRYAIPASAYEKLAYTLLLCALLYVALTGVMAVKLPEVAGKIVSGISLFGIFILYVPNIAYKLQYINLDDSWRYFLNVAGPKGYTFGKDITFTYGPLGYLCYMMNLPSNKTYYWAGVGIWGVVIALFIYLLFRIFKAYLDEKISAFSIVLSFVLAFASYKVLERDNFLLYLLILSVAVLDIEPGVRKLTKIVQYVIPNFLLVLMFFAKFSTFSSGFAFVTIYTLYKLIFLKDWRTIFIGAPSVLLMPLCYLIYNPSIKDLKFYVSGFFKHSNDWMEAWQYDVTVQGSELFALVVIMLLFVVLLVLSLIRDYKSAGVILALSASMFFVYKYATTRHGLPCGIWLFGMMYSVIPFVLRGIQKKLFIPLCTCVIVTGLFEANVMHNTFDDFGSTLKQKAHNYTHLQEVGIEDTVNEYLWDIPDSVIQTIGYKTVCIYPYRVAMDSVYSQLNVIYQPDVMNGQASEWLDRLVADWYSSDEAADFLIMDDETVDGHIKYLENPLTWQAIKSNYHLIGVDDWHCVMEKNEEHSAYEKPMKLIGTTEVGTGENITVPEGADYAKVIMEYSLLGKLKKFFYHVGTLGMAINYDDESTIHGRIIKNNLETGFELWNYPQDTEELVEYMLYGPYKKIEQFRIYGMGLNDLEPQMTIEWYSYK